MAINPEPRKSTNSSTLNVHFFLNCYCSQKYFKNDLTVCVFLLTASCDVASEQTIQQLPQKRTEGTWTQRQPSRWGQTLFPSPDGVQSSRKSEDMAQESGFVSKTRSLQRGSDSEVMVDILKDLFRKASWHIFSFYFGSLSPFLKAWKSNAFLPCWFFDIFHLAEKEFLSFLGVSDGPGSRWIPSGLPIPGWALTTLSNTVYLQDQGLTSARSRQSWDTRPNPIQVFWELGLCHSGKNCQFLPRANTVRIKGSSDTDFLLQVLRL